MSVPLRYRRHHGLQTTDAQHIESSQSRRGQGPMTPSGRHPPTNADGADGSQQAQQYYDMYQYQQQQHQYQQYMQQYAQHYAQHYADYSWYQQQHPHHPQQHQQYPQMPYPSAAGQYAMPDLASLNLHSSLPSSPQLGSSKSGSESPSLDQRVMRKQRPYNRADRAMGQIVDVENDNLPNKDAIDRLLASTKSTNLSQDENSPLSSPPLSSGSQETLVNRRFNNHQILNEKCNVVIKLPSRRVSKQIAYNTQACDLANQLVKEHRLEFDFENNNEGDGEEIILWECIDGTRRPLRSSEQIGPIVRRWTSKGQHCCLRTTSTSLRNDVDSLASLVPRRDMLRTPPQILAAEVHFSRPSIMYNPHMNQYEPRSPPLSPSPEYVNGFKRHGSVHNGTSRGESKDPEKGRSTTDIIGTNGNTGSSSLQRAPSKLNPSDKGLVAKRIQEDNDDVSLQTQLVWGFGSLDLDAGRVVLKQKPGDELVCSLDVTGTDVYEWPHTGPKKYVFVLRAQQLNSRAVYISTDSAKVFSVLRNGIFTARTRALLQQQQQQRKQ